MTTNNKPAAEICLYGSRSAGFDFLATTPADGEVRFTADGMKADGRLRFDSLTEAVWTAVDAIRGAGVAAGTVAIYAPSGEHVALADLRHVPAFGDLKWQAAPVYRLSISDL